MKILHTSDWHLGRSLYGKQRFNEFSSFLDWLLETIVKEGIDILLVAGDIFDTSTPGTRAQELYYSFLCKITGTCCRHMVITAGNHDSPSFLSAPKDILKYLNIHIVASVENLNNEVIRLTSGSGESEAIICAVPYLRDKDIRSVQPGESIDQKSLNLVNGIASHYTDVCSIAENMRDGNIPIIGMGHLFVTGGKTLADDGVRELYVGTLAHIGAEIFPPSMDYVALGHLHVPQKVGGSEIIRYSGSPIPMGFGEAKQNKKIIVVNFSSGKAEIKEVIVPRFQELVRITGNCGDIIKEISGLKEKNSSAWLEIEYTGSEIVPTLQADINEIVIGSELEVRVIKNRFISNKTLDSLDSTEELENLGVDEVFNRYLNIYDIDEAERPLLKQLYGEVVNSMGEDDNEN